jgi:hypothetical protein
MEKFDKFKEECTFHPMRIAKKKDKVFIKGASMTDKENSPYDRLYNTYKEKAKKLDTKRQEIYD